MWIKSGAGEKSVPGLLLSGYRIRLIPAVIATVQCGCRTFRRAVLDLDRWKAHQHPGCKEKNDGSFDDGWHSAFDFVAAGPGHLLHARRLYPYFACPGDHCYFGSRYSGAPPDSLRRYIG